MNQPRLGKRIRFDEIFNEEPKSKLYYLEGIGKEVLLKLIPALITGLKKKEYSTAFGVISGWLHNQVELSITQNSKKI